MPETNIYISLMYKWQNASSQYLPFTYLQVTKFKLSIFTFHLFTSDKIQALNIYISLMYKWQNSSSQYLHFTYVQVTEYQLSVFTFHLFTSDGMPALNINISLMYKWQNAIAGWKFPGYKSARVVNLNDSAPYAPLSTNSSSSPGSCIIQQLMRAEEHNQ